MRGNFFKLVGAYNIPSLAELLDKIALPLFKAMTEICGVCSLWNVGLQSPPTIVLAPIMKKTLGGIR